MSKRCSQTPDPPPSRWRMSPGLGRDEIDEFRGIRNNTTPIKLARGFEEMLTMRKPMHAVC